MIMTLMHVGICYEEPLSTCGWFIWQPSRVHHPPNSRLCTGTGRSIVHRRPCADRVARHPVGYLWCGNSGCWCLCVSGSSTRRSRTETVLTKEPSFRHSGNGSCDDSYSVPGNLGPKQKSDNRRGFRRFFSAVRPMAMSSQCYRIGDASATRRIVVI